VHPAGIAPQRHYRSQGLPACWLPAEWPHKADAPMQYWLSSLPPDTPLKTLVRQAKLRWRVEHDYREMKTGLGPGHFEGRTWNGFHHHVTCFAHACAFLTRPRLGKPPAVCHYHTPTWRLLPSQPSTTKTAQYSEKPLPTAA
jgi:SRSO17 transposase